MKLSYSAFIIFTLTTGSAWAGLEGTSNTAYGLGAGFGAGDNDESVFIGASAGYNTTTGSYNVFVGRSAGITNTSGGQNTFLGYVAGYNNTLGGSNTFIGDNAGYFNNTGINNTFIGKGSGYSNTIGVGNVFLGHAAGYLETGSNRLYIANSSTATPLIYGEFNNGGRLTINGNLEVVGPDNGLVRLSNTIADNTTKAARMVLNHYNNAALPVYLFGAASTPGNNFLAFGGGNAIGNAATQLDFFTAPTTTTAVGSSRMTINGAGNIGMGVPAPAHPLHMASGALVTSGGVWTNASSRDYKENIKDLSTKEAALTLASLTPVTYNYKVDKAQGHVGFIAEDVPELVATKDRKGLSPMDIVAVLTKVTQEQQKTMEAYEKRAEEQERVNQEQQIALQAQERVNQEQQKMMQAQQQIITELNEQNKAMAEQTKLIPTLSTALTELKREVRMGRTTALAD